MARGECSYKRTTLVVCSVNIVVALYVLHSLYASVYNYSFTDTHTIFKYSANQISIMEESNQIRKAAEPTELIRLVSQLKERFVSEERVERLPQHLKQKLIYEILDKFRSLDAAANGTEQRGAVSRALGSDWSEMSKEIGLWIPVEIVNKEHDDKPESDEELDEEILPGRKLPPECHAELHSDYDGAAVRWGLTHHKDSAYECCMSCLDQARRAKPGQKKCNIWVYCPSETGCYSPDIYEHKHGECWLKHSETPKLNFKDKYPESYRDAHVNAPVVVPWVSGVITM
ncbi:uncharacterized protein LOC131001332 isoform X2 [Salvia miltiorrhiza]|uniref:uncharacterized protein LOC131001332 isoform X2 n=1 Tax=Salvia miltiorrhiza TaxID=226208 RepID=UPI0025AD0AF6|nr:uncharacterized protein LOC131001332 isoform X2 [Salvia miltiorrhiza]